MKGYGASTFFSLRVPLESRFRMMNALNGHGQERFKGGTKKEREGGGGEGGGLQRGRAGGREREGRFRGIKSSFGFGTSFNSRKH